MITNDQLATLFANEVKILSDLELCPENYFDVIRLLNSVSTTVSCYFKINATSQLEKLMHMTDEAKEPVFDSLD